MTLARALLSAGILAAALTPSCGKGEDTAPAAQPTAPTAYFDLGADFTSSKSFFEFPYPSDLRLDEKGAPIANFPDPFTDQNLAGLRRNASQRKGFPVVAAGYVRFRASLAPRKSVDAIAALAASPILLVDVDDGSPEKGRLIPVVAETLAEDDYVPSGVLAFAPRPGFVLAPLRKYAFVVRTELGDATGAPLATSPELAKVRAGTSGGPLGAKATALYAPLWSRLKELAVPESSIAAATVFTTGDVVTDTFALSELVLAQHQAVISDLAVDPDDGASHPRFCELRGKITLPQFQEGTPPFKTGGSFSVGADGAPKKQRDEKVPFTLTLPKGPMPAAGYPLLMYFHGSGGDSLEAVDSGAKLTKDGPYGKGLGPTHVVAEHGFAMASSAFPISPERVLGAGDFDYLNFDNIASMRDTFRQGTLEQRLFIRALASLTVDPALLTACSGMSLPAGAKSFSLDQSRLAAIGLSMGGMYTNILSSVEPKIGAAVPTGAGGYWSYFVANPGKGVTGLQVIVNGLFHTGREPAFLHPMLQLFETGAEEADPFVYMPRVARNPLPGHPSRGIYEPVGKDDRYFPTVLYDAIALAYGHRQAGDAVWPSMQDALRLAALDGLVGFPLTNNLKAQSGTPYTGAVVQYQGDGIGDPHVIVFQLDAVKYQYGCFFKSYRDKGVATIPAPGPLGTSCPN